MSAGSAPFDTAAAAYDEAFTTRPLARLLRAAARTHLEAAFGPGDRVLELGCGTGEDAVWLAARGVRVTATDASPAMLARAAEKARARGLADGVDLVRTDLAEGELPEAPGGFDGSFSSFGPLNCLEKRRRLAASLADRVRPGAPVLLMVMGPLCPWEVGWHLLRLEPAKAFRRLRRGAEAPVGNPPVAVRVWYPTPRRLRSDFEPWFRHRRTVGIGVVLPPPYLARLVEGRPALLRRLASWDRRAGAGFPGTWLNDHYLSILERRGTR